MEAINVVARFRGAESGQDENACWELSDQTIKNKERYHDFTLDTVLTPSDSQSRLYEKSSHSLVKSL
jgi:hypothetical protein